MNNDKVMCEELAKWREVIDNAVNLYMGKYPCVEKNDLYSQAYLSWIQAYRAGGVDLGVAVGSGLAEYCVKECEHNMNIRAGKSVHRISEEIIRNQTERSYGTNHTVGVLHGLLSEFDDMERGIATLAWVQDLPTDEISIIYNIPMKTVENILVQQMASIRNRGITLDDLTGLLFM